jgi:hypothetical protein
LLVIGVKYFELPLFSRLSRIQELSKLLTEQNILLSAVIQDAQKLETRWNDLSMKARQRTTLLEGKCFSTEIVLVKKGS